MDVEVDGTVAQDVGILVTKDSQEMAPVQGVNLDYWGLMYLDTYLNMNLSFCQTMTLLMWHTLLVQTFIWFLPSYSYISRPECWVFYNFDYK